MYNANIYDEDQDLDLGDTSSTEKEALDSISCLGTEFLTCQAMLDHPNAKFITNRDARAIKQAQRSARAYLNKQRWDSLAIWKVFKAVYSAEIAFDSWSSIVWLKKRGSYPLDLLQKTSVNKMLNNLEEVLGKAIHLPQDFKARQLEDFQEQHSFNPVQHYLEGLPKVTPRDWQDWSRLAEILFGVTDQQSQIYLSRWLIAAVARAMQPGCKVDSALVIQGKQGASKTSFFQALFGDWFRTLHATTKDTDRLRILQQAWGCELGEIEATFRAKDISQLKADLTETHDSFRALYKELGEPRPRHCVFAGTTNETAFLNDPTGSRRFWVIATGEHKIPVEWVRVNRDNIWACAYSLWEAKEQHWLTSEEEELSELSNRAYQADNAFVEHLETVLDILNRDKETQESVAIKGTDVMKIFLGLAVSQQGGKNSKDFASAMKQIGWEKRKFNNKAMKGAFYVKEGATEVEPFNLRMAEGVEEARRTNPREPHKRDR